MGYCWRTSFICYSQKKKKKSKKKKTKKTKQNKQERAELPYWPQQVCITYSIRHNPTIKQQQQQQQPKPQDLDYLARAGSYISSSSRTELL